MFLLGAHLAECAGMAVGAEDGVVAESLVAARGKDQVTVDAALEGFKPSVRPGEGEHADEPGPPWRSRAERHELALDSRHGGDEIFRLPRPARGIDSRRAAQALRRRAPNRLRALGCPEACAAAFAFNKALSRNVDPVSSGSARSSSAAPIVRIPYGLRSSRISLSLPALWVATTTRPESLGRAPAPALIGRRPCIAGWRREASPAPGR